MFNRYMNHLRKYSLSSLELLLVIVCLTGCKYRSGSVVTILPNSSPFPAFETAIPLETMATHPPSPTLQTTRTSTLVHTSSPAPKMTRQVVTQTSVNSGNVIKDILLLLSEDLGTSSTRDSIWVQSSKETTPHILIKDPSLTFDFPRWSHDGEWIAFRQSNWLNKSSFQVGVIHRDGSRKHVFEETFGAIGWLNWSADDKFLIFDTLYSPYAIDVDTGESLDLWPDSDHFGAQTRLKPSPIEDLIAYAEFEQEPGTEAKLWLLNLVGQRRENIPFPAEIPLTCRQGITTLDWSPDGASIITQFRGWPPEECKPQLWLYELAEKKWTNVAGLPSDISSYDFNEIGQVTWSKDGRWLAWETTRNVLFLAVKEKWKIVRKISIGIDEFPMAFPWVEDTNKNALYSLNRSDFSNSTRQIVYIIGLSPGGTTLEDRELSRFEEDPSWMPNISYFYPMIWEP